MNDRGRDRTAGADAPTPAPATADAATGPAARWRRTSLATRLLVGQLVVVLASIATAGVVSSLLGPTIFHRHILEVTPGVSQPEIRHVEYAYRDASTIALATGLAVALAVAVLVSWYVGRRLQASLQGMTQAAGEVAAGNYQVELPEHGHGQELDELATAFNSMAATIRQSEATRRRLLTDVGHELRTPLSTMSTHLDALEDGVVDWDPELQRLFRDQVTRMSALARDISAVSRAEEGAVRLEPVPMDAADLVEAAVAELAAAYADKGVELRTNLPAVPVDDATTVQVDPARMGQVLVNLLANALRHTPAGGTVTVAVRPEGMGPAARAGAVASGVAIIVEDTGEGIGPEVLPHVFERFYRGSTAREHDHTGSGVGLTISQALVRRHGGTLTAASAGEGRGSTFTVWLPTA